jgi:hypothetical protein
MRATMSAVYWVMLDRDYRIIAASTITGQTEENIGQIIWDVFPASQSLYRDLYARAWDDGCADGHAFHLGRLVHVSAERTAAGLLVAYRVLAELDTVTLTALSQSLDLLENLAVRATGGCGRPSRRALRIVQETPDR